jgi:hypothetical protein
MEYSDREPRCRVRKFYTPKLEHTTDYCVQLPRRSAQASGLRQPARVGAGQITAPLGRLLPPCGGAAAGRVRTLPRPAGKG